MRKSAISVTVSNAEPEVQFLAGMPTSPTAAIARPEVLAIPRRVPKTMSLKTEGSVPEAIAEGGREMVSQLERKFGEAFFRGFLDELEKMAGYQIQTGISPLQKGIRLLKQRPFKLPPTSAERLESAVKLREGEGARALRPSPLPMFTTAQ